MAMRTLQSLLLAVWAAFFCWLLSAGQAHLARLLHPRLWWLVAVGAGIVLIFLFVNLARLPASRGQGGLRWQWPGLAILLVPVLYAYPLSGARLDSGAFSRLALRPQDGFVQGETMPGSEEIPALRQLDSGDERDIPLTRLYAEQEQYVGKPVEVVCQLFKDASLPHDLSICYRFTIFCCAADARPIFVFLRPSEALAGRKSDDWLRVQGVLGVYENNGLRTLQIEPERVEAVREPAFPFVF